MEWIVVKCKLWVQQYFIFLLKLFYWYVVIHSSKNKMEKVNGFAVIFDEI